MIVCATAYVKNWIFFLLLSSISRDIVKTTNTLKNMIKSVLTPDIRQTLNRLSKIHQKEYPLDDYVKGSIDNVIEYYQSYEHSLDLLTGRLYIVIYIRYFYLWEYDALKNCLEILIEQTKRLN